MSEEAVRQEAQERREGMRIVSLQIEDLRSEVTTVKSDVSTVKAEVHTIAKSVRAIKRRARRDIAALTEELVLK